MRREINYVNAGQIVTQIFGHSKDLITLSLSLSLSLSGTNSQSTTINKRGHTRVNIRLFLSKAQGKPVRFCPRLHLKP